MPDTHAYLDSDRHVAQPTATPNLTWLLAANDAEHQRHQLFRNPREEEQMLLMRHPLNTHQAYAMLGLLLGLLPPAAIFYKLFGYGFAEHNGNDAVFITCLFLAMNVVCSIVGRRMGGALGGRLEKPERASWSIMILSALYAGICWGLITGAAGGFLFFGFGAIAGVFCALPVGVLAFTLFTPLHRLLARGGMIDAQHFWPLASGITLTISALILGM